MLLVKTQVPRRQHSFVQYTGYDNAVVDDAKIYDVALYLESPISNANVITSVCDLRLRSQRIKRNRKLIRVAVRLLDSPFGQRI